MLESPVTPACARVIAAWFPSDERGLADAVFNSAQYLSLAIFTLMGFIFHYAGWPHIFSVMGAVGIALSLVWLLQYHSPGRDRRLSPDEFDDITACGALTELGDIAPTDTAAAATGHPGVTTLRLLSNRMLVGIFFAQYCIASLSTFFIPWFPSYLVEARHFTMLEAGFVAALPAICGCVGGVSSGFFSDWLLRRSGSLGIARKVPITIGLCLSATIILCNYTASNVIVVVVMCAAFFGKGFGALGWTVIADTAPQASDRHDRGPVQRRRQRRRNHHPDRDRREHRQDRIL